jgi:uncharacterized protein
LSGGFVYATTPPPNTWKECVMDFFLCVLGMVLIIEGMPYFASPDKVKAYLMKIQEIPDSTLRIIGFVSMATGLLLIYFGRS